ncbi:MAG: zeta toxin family protein [Defluviitaleaceae bacterium]|nr:zeta toxin family protein [Defluviitaleaceae bacterium]MCL2273928.1 zeta toxin family protein [Defluviitaleaceae bacterium]
MLSKKAQIVIISGSPATGKTSIAEALAEKLPNDRIVHIHTDDFYNYIHKGYIKPWLPEASEQNTIVIESYVASTKVFALNDYTVIVDGVIGAWFLEPWRALRKEGFDVRYIILCPDLETAITRNNNRNKQLPIETITDMWNSFSSINSHKNHTIDTTLYTIDESTLMIMAMINEGKFKLNF